MWCVSKQSKLCGGNLSFHQVLRDNTGKEHTSPPNSKVLLAPVSATKLITNEATMSWMTNKKATKAVKRKRIEL